MALVVCIECQKEVSDKAEQCPHCGARIRPAPTPTATAACWTPVSTGRSRSSAWRVVRYILLLAVVAAGWWVWQSMTSDKKAPFSAGFSAAFREPRTIADERPSLKAGQNVVYTFALQTDARVHVRVTAVTGPVDMMLLAKADADRFRSAGGELFGGGYSGHPAFSETQVGMLDKTDVVKKGEWALVVMRPKGAAGAESAPAQIALTVY